MSGETLSVDRRRKQSALLHIVVDESALAGCTRNTTRRNND